MANLTVGTVQGISGRFYLPDTGVTPVPGDVVSLIGNKLQLTDANDATLASKCLGICLTGVIDQNVAKTAKTGEYIKVGTVVTLRWEGNSVKAFVRKGNETSVGTALASKPKGSTVSYRPTNHGKVWVAASFSSRISLGVKPSEGLFIASATPGKIAPFGDLADGMYLTFVAALSDNEPRFRVIVFPTGV